MANIYPGKKCRKKVADMTEEEHKQHRVYANAATRAHAARRLPKRLSIYPGKRSHKLVADMTKSELKQHRIYCNSIYNKMSLADPAIKVKAAKYAKEWRLKNPEKAKAQKSKCLAKRLKDPIRYETYLAKGREVASIYIENVSDYYVRSILCRQTGTPAYEIPTDVVEQRRIKIVLGRLIKFENQ
tara:strand:- start:432 stop:986 length:555 start_codon:yes stop_codon:yes gene_type:complete